MSDTPKTATEIKAELAHFTGTEGYHRHGLVRSVVLSDGALHFADLVGAHWLIDILATELPGFVREHEIVFTKATAKDGKAEIVARADSDKPPFWTRKIDWTDLPEGEWELWFAQGGPQGALVIFLPSEY